MAGIDKDADRDWHFAASDQIVHDGGCSIRSRTVLISVAVLKHHQCGGLFGVVLFGDVDGISSDRAGKRFRFQDLALNDVSLRDILNHGIRSEVVGFLFLSDG